MIYVVNACEIQGGADSIKLNDLIIYVVQDREDATICLRSPLKRMNLLPWYLKVKSSHHVRLLRSRNYYINLKKKTYKPLDFMKI